MSRIIDNVVTDKILFESLLEIAKQDAERDEFHVEEHTCWMAAMRLQELYGMVHGQNDAELLYEIAQRLRDETKLKEMMEKDE